MSAIFGIFNLDGRPLEGTDLERMDAALAAHGPDGGGIWMQGPVGLGQRLMRFTPEDCLEHQPLVGAGGDLMLVADARIDNRPELASVLDISAAEARDLPDSAFILRAYEKWGEECPRHLVGEFAFAIWDARRQALLAARSPRGERMLCYHSTPRTFAFATMPRGLLALPFIPRVLNEAGVADYLVQIGRELNTTFYQGIYRLLPGQRMTVRRNSLNIQCYWQPDLKREIRYASDDDYVEAFIELFERVLGDHLRSLTPVGGFMSGGLDSASVAAMAASQLRGRGERFTSYTEVPRAGFDGPVLPGRYADETPFVQAMARRHENIALHLVRTDGHHFLEDAESFFTHAEMLFPNTSNRVWWEAILRQARADGVRVLLTGEAGNLTVSWNGSGLLQELMRDGQWKRALHEARASVRRGEGRSVWRVLAGQGLLPLLPARLLTPLERYRHRANPFFSFDLKNSLIHPDFAAAQHLQEHLRAKANVMVYQSRAATQETRCRMLTQLDLRGSIMTAYRAMFGVDTRDPLGDIRIVEFCLALPEAQYRRDGEPHWLIRRALADRLPPEVLENRKRGLQAADWFERLSLARDEIGRELQSMERSELARRMLNLARLRRLFDEWPQGGWGEPDVLAAYRGTLEPGLMAGRFLRWFEAGN